MDGLKELVEAFSARIKSPIIGSIVLAFLAINWKPVFYLFFSGEPASDKFVYFKVHTTGYSLYLLPVIVGLVYALLMPWINFWGAKAIEAPVSKHRNMQLDAAHALAEKKTRHAIDMETLDADYRSALLKGAKVEQDIKEADIDEDVRADLEEKIRENPAAKNLNNIKLAVKNINLSAGAYRILKAISENKHGEYEVSDNGKTVKIGMGGKPFFSDIGYPLESDGRESYLTMQDDIKELQSSRLVEGDKGSGRISKLGYQYLSFRKQLKGIDNKSIFQST